MIILINLYELIEGPKALYSVSHKFKYFFEFWTIHARRLLHFLVKILVQYVLDLRYDLFQELFGIYIFLNRYFQSIWSDQRSKIETMFYFYTAWVITWKKFRIFSKKIFISVVYYNFLEKKILLQYVSRFRCEIIYEII